MASSSRVRSRQRISRPELARRVRSALDDGSLLLVAEAGFGKTMAIDEALVAASQAAAWVACTAADRDAAQLLLDVIAAIRRSQPGAADVMGEALVAASAPIDAAAACRGLLRDLDRLLVEPLVLVLDDAEQLASSGDSVALVQLLLAGAGERLRVVVATRRDLDLRLAKLTAARAVTVLGPAALAFDAGECARLLELRQGRPPAEAQVAMVMESTEGWPLGIALAALTAPGQEQLAARRSRADVFAFLAEEVVEQLAPGERAALIDSSVVRELSAEMVDALGLPPGFLATIERQGLFLRAVDPEHRRFRYHPLFREYLLGRFVAERDRDTAQAQHARAAAALAAAGDHAQAAEHWLAAGDHGPALDAMVIDRDTLLRGSHDAVAAALAGLPEDVRARPGADLLAGLLDWSAGRHAEAVPPLQRAATGFRATGELECEWVARLALSDAGSLAAQPDVVIAAAEGFDAPAGLQAGARAPLVAMYAAQALADLGRRDASAKMARRALAHPAGAHAQPLELERALCWEHLPAGRFEAALSDATAAVSGLEDAAPVELTTAMAFLGAVHVAAGDHEAALAVYSHAQRIGEESGVAAYMADEMRWTRAEVQARAGRIEAAAAELASASAVARSVTGMWRVELVQAALALQQGSPDRAVAAVERALTALHDASLLNRLSAPTALVPLLARAGCPDRAGHVLADAIALCDERFPEARGSFFAARLLVVRAWLRSAGGDGTASDLQQAWQAAGAAVPQLLRGQWRELKPLVWEALADGTLDAPTAIGAIERGWPGGEALIEFMTHPAPAVRRLATAAAAASGRPDALEQLDRLERDADAEVALAARTAAGRIRRDPPPLSFVVLGGFALRRGGWNVPEAAFGRPIAARVLRFMLVHRGTLLPEDALFEAFWPEKPPASARRNLAVALSLIRRVLDPQGAEHSLIETGDRAYRLVLRERDGLDCDGFQRSAGAALAATGPAARAQLERAERLWTGEPLPEDRYAHWTTVWREELVDRYLQLLGALAQHYGRSEDHADAIRTARKCVQIDPLNETWQRELIAAYARAGRTSHALRQYLECRRALVDALGVEPAAATSRLQARILAGEAV